MQVSEGRRPSGGMHFQLYLATAESDVCWRLLSGNNRDMGRSAAGYPGTEECTMALKELVGELDALTSLVRRKAATNRWIWTLRRGEVPVAESAHSYDRQIRAEAACQHFVQHAAIASISSVVMISASRRGVVRGGRGLARPRSETNEVGLNSASRFAANPPVPAGRPQPPKELL
jgi:hypothetical protein